MQLPTHTTDGRPARYSVSAIYEIITPAKRYGDSRIYKSEQRNERNNARRTLSRVHTHTHNWHEVRATDRKMNRNVYAEPANTVPSYCPCICTDLNGGICRKSRKCIHKHASQYIHCRLPMWQGGGAFTNNTQFVLMGFACDASFFLQRWCCCCCCCLLSLFHFFFYLGI